MITVPDPYISIACEKDRCDLCHFGHLGLCKCSCHRETKEVENPS